jgi:hypothetical protein
MFKERGTQMDNKQATRTPGALIPHKRLAQDLAVCTRTLSTRAKTDPNFPKVIVYNRRRFYEEHACVDYKRKLVSRAMGA